MGVPGLPNSGELMNKLDRVATALERMAESQERLAAAQEAANQILV